MGKAKKAVKGKEDQDRRAEILEALVELYLRLNGYFCITNYLYHKAIDEWGLGTESDILAIRLPHQAEMVPDERTLKNDKRLFFEEGEGKIVCVIGEVKEPSVEFNKPIRGANGPQWLRVALRRFGMFPESEFSPNGEGSHIVEKLHRQIREPRWAQMPWAESKKYNTCVRMLVFSRRGATHSMERAFLALEDILHWVTDRTNPGQRCAPYPREVGKCSPWRGVMRQIVETVDTLRMGDSSLEDFVRIVQSRL